MRNNNISRNGNKCSEKCCTNLIWYAIIKTAFVPTEKYPDLIPIWLFGVSKSESGLLRVFNLQKCDLVNKIRREAIFKKTENVPRRISV